MEGSMIGRIFAAAAAIVVGFGPHAANAELKILCANGMREVVSELLPQFGRVAGQQVTVTFGEAGDLAKRIQAGEVADVIILPRTVLDQVAAQGSIAAGTIVDLAQSSMGIGVRADGPKPDIGSPEKLKQALLAARSIV